MGIIPDSTRVLSVKEVDERLQGHKSLIEFFLVTDSVAREDSICYTKRDTKVEQTDKGLSKQASFYML